ncbi:MAG TPA: AAA family ATPase [bacterium]|nr:AAA family ATPase [bacterium]
MQISADKKETLQKLVSWYKAGPRTQYITLGGYAGTGKTTLIGIFRSLIHSHNPQVKVGFISYTGKAARVLKNKLGEFGALQKGDSVSTIHSLIYSPIINNKEEIIGWQKRDEIDKDFLIIDEGSMLDEEIWLDLLSYNKPIFAVGDHGQLPPIGEKFNLMANPNLELTQIHRQVRENPIIEISRIARETGKIPFKEFGRGVIKMDKTCWETQEKINNLLEEYNEDTIILCGYNKTRVAINTQIRQYLGFNTPVPEVGDRVICLRNNQKNGIFNGMLGQISLIEPYEKNMYFAKIKMEDGFIFEGPILKSQFGSSEPLNFTNRRRDTLECDLFDFGYAMTVHKAQGSQAKRVILFEERFPKMDDEQWRRWLYTGVTRAEEELYIVG